MTAADVLIIGAGPAGATAGAILNKRGFTCRIIERAHFPRFSIGESLLPQCMDFLDEAGLLEAVQEARFQLKDGARFLHHGQYATFYFNDQYTPGWDHTFEVVRADFDKILADEAERQGVAITYGQQIDAVRFTEDGVALTATDESGTTHAYEGRFLLDASGFGRVLPRLLDLERPSTFPARRAFFTHIEDRIDHADFDRDKILVTIHPEHQDVWIWLIPFSNGRASVGVVAEESFLEAVPGDAETKLKTLIGEDDTLREILGNAVFDTPVNTLFGYSTNVSQMCGDRFAGPSHPSVSSSASRASSGRPSAIRASASFCPAFGASSIPSCRSVATPSTSATRSSALR